MNSYETLTLEITGAVATLTLAGRQSGNPLGALAGKELSHALSRIASAPSLRLLVLRAKGKAFCVGGDLTEFIAMEELSASIRTLVVDFHGACATISSLNVPVISVVQGAVAGAGLALISLSDHVVASTEATFTYAYPGIGFSADGGVTWLLPKLMGLRAFQTFATGGRSWSAGEAMAAGLVSTLVDPAELDATATTLIDRIATGPTRAYGAIRRLAFESYSTPYAAHLVREMDEIAELASGNDAPSAIRSVLQRERPKFVGR